MIVGATPVQTSCVHTAAFNYHFYSGMPLGKRKADEQLTKEMYEKSEKDEAAKVRFVMYTLLCIAKFTHQYFPM